MMADLYHYTKLGHLGSILSTGEIRPTCAGVPVGERPAVWLSTDSHWEGTVGDIKWMATSETTFPIRFRVRGEYATWADHRAHGGVIPEMADALERVAVATGAEPAAWRVSYDPIARKDWLAIEVYDHEAVSWYELELD